MTKEDSGNSLNNMTRLQFRFLPLVFLSLAVAGIMNLEYLRYFLIAYVVLSTYMSILFAKAGLRKYAAGNAVLLSVLMLYLIFVVRSDLSQVLTWVLLNSGTAFMGYYAYMNSLES